MKIDVIDMFSGCGGMSWGFKNAELQGAEYRLIGAIDIDRHANATYERNLGIKPAEIDIAMLDSDDDLLAEFLGGIDRDPDNPLVLIGCAPCQGFSSHRKKDPRKDERNSLIEHFGSVAAKIQPDVVVMENVPDIFAKKHWKHYSVMRDMLKEAGYVVRARIYNLAEFGVPQERFRATILAFRHRCTTSFGSCSGSIHHRGTTASRARKGWGDDFDSYCGSSGLASNLDRFLGWLAH